MENSKYKILPKNKGTSIMISGFMCPCHGFMTSIIDGEIQFSYHFFEAGINRDGWFNNEDLINQYKSTLKFIEHIHPDDVLLFVFHHKKPPDGLDITYLNLSDGGTHWNKEETVPMRSTIFEKDGIWYKQNMQHFGVQKGLKTILKERGEWVDGLNKVCPNEWVTEIIKATGHLVDFYPKYHCELNFI